MITYLVLIAKRQRMMSSIYHVKMRLNMCQLKSYSNKGKSALTFRESKGIHTESIFTEKI